MIKISFKYYLIIKKLFAVQNLYFYPLGNFKRNFFFFIKCIFNCQRLVHLLVTPW